MSAFDILAGLLSLAAGLAYVNHRWLHRPASIAFMALSLALSLGLLAAARLSWLDVQPILAQGLTLERVARRFTA